MAAPLPFATTTRVSEIMRSNLPTLEPATNLRLALQMMLWSRCRQLPVVNEQHELLGLVSEHDIQRALSQQRLSGLTVTEVMHDDVTVVDPETTIADAAQLIAEAQTASVPVVFGGRLVGMVTSIDLLTFVARTFATPAPQGPQIAEVMGVKVSSATMGQTLADAVLEMVNSGVRQLPIVDADQVVVGILSDRDLRELIGDPTLLETGEFNDLMGMAVEEAMNADPITLRRDEPVEALSAAMLDHRVGAVPIVDDRGRLVGTVSYVDVLHGVLGDSITR